MVAGQPNVVDQFQWRELQSAADVLGVQLQSLEVRHAGDFKALFAAAVRERAEALVTLDCVYTNMAQTEVAALAATHRLPGMYFYRAAVEAGGLMSYTAVWGGGQWQRVAVYVDKILRGTKPADLPVEQPLQFEFIINLKTAKQIGLTIPPNVLARADKVIK
jgi:putative ABC transport system substrate-binding protein